MESGQAASEAGGAGRGGRIAGGASALDLVRLARPHQWAKSAFVLIGPAYGWADVGMTAAGAAVSVVIAAVCFALVSSCCYVVNDIVDAEQDRAHPRKRMRPIASGAVSPRTALAFAGGLLAAVVALLAFLDSSVRWWVVLCLGLYVVNVTVYSFAVKHVVIADVMGLSLGFVLRVLGGCAAVGIAPSTWLLNCTFFIAMFLAFGKRLGERRTMEGEAASARSVQEYYTDDLLRMVVVVTGVATLITYAGYVQSREEDYTVGFNLLWLTVLPATYGIVRCMVLLERGRYDDPTELAANDRAFQLAAALFVLLTVVVIWLPRSVSG